MSVHDPAKFQQYSVIFARSVADTKNRMFFWDHGTFYGRHCTVPDKRGLGQPACPKEWKKYEGRNE
jgi:hypothetical protein